jgi:hypothetical protein
LGCKSHTSPRPKRVSRVVQHQRVHVASLCCVTLVQRFAPESSPAAYPCTRRGESSDSPFKTWRPARSSMIGSNPHVQETARRQTRSFVIFLGSNILDASTSVYLVCAQNKPSTSRQNKTKVDVVGDKCPSAHASASRHVVRTDIPRGEALETGSGMSSRGERQARIGKPADTSPIVTWNYQIDSPHVVPFESNRSYTMVYQPNLKQARPCVPHGNSPHPSWDTLCQGRTSKYLRSSHQTLQPCIQGERGLPDREALHGISGGTVACTVSSGVIRTLLTSQLAAVWGPELGTTPSWRQTPALPPLDHPAKVHFWSLWRDFPEKVHRVLLSELHLGLRTLGCRRQGKADSTVLGFLVPQQTIENEKEQTTYVYANGHTWRATPTGKFLSQKNREIE